MASPTSTSPVSSRLSGEERRAAIIRIATEEFAQRGYSGGSTEVMAKRAGISQPYIFRLFGTKRELFLAVLDVVCAHILEVITAASHSSEHDKLSVMGQAYAKLNASRHEMLLLFQAISASGDKEICSDVQRRYWTLFKETQALSGASHAQMQEFFAKGLLLTAATLLELPELLTPDTS